MDIGNSKMLSDKTGEGFNKLRLLEMDCQVHGCNKLFKCFQCGKAFSKKSSIVCHMRLHTGEKPFTCTQCSCTFAHKSTLLNHSRLHTGEKPYECEICLKRFRQRSNYYLHKKIHTKEKSFECDICSKKFAQRVHLTTHKRLHTGEKPYICKECNKGFSQRCHLNRHQTVHVSDKFYSCEICDKKFASSDHLRSHIRSHTGTQKKKSKHSRSFAEKNTFNSFLKEDGLNLASSSNYPDKSKKKQNLECEFCHKKCIKKSHLRHHIFIHTGEKPYKCTTCKKKFSERGSLNRHMKLHSGTCPNTILLTGCNIFSSSVLDSKCGTNFPMDSAFLMNHRANTTELMLQRTGNTLENDDKSDLVCSEETRSYLTSLASSARLDNVGVNDLSERTVPLVKKRRKIHSSVLVDENYSDVNKTAEVEPHLPGEPVSVSDARSGHLQILTKKEELGEHVVSGNISYIEHLKVTSKTEEYHFAEKAKAKIYVSKEAGAITCEFMVTKQCPYMSKYPSKCKYLVNSNECENQLEEHTRCSYFCNNVGSRVSLFSGIPVFPGKLLAPTEPVLSVACRFLPSEVPEALNEYLPLVDTIETGEFWLLTDQIDSKEFFISEPEPGCSQQVTVEEHTGDRPVEGISKVTPSRQAGKNGQEVTLPYQSSSRKLCGWSPSSSMLDVSFFLLDQQVKEEGARCEIGIKEEVDVGDEIFDSL